MLSRLSLIKEVFRPIYAKVAVPLGLFLSGWNWLTDQFDVPKIPKVWKMTLANVEPAYWLFLALSGLVYGLFEYVRRSAGPVAQAVANQPVREEAATHGMSEDEVRALIKSAVQPAPTPPAAPEALLDDVKAIGEAVERHEALFATALRPTLDQYLQRIDLAGFTGRVHEYLEGVKLGAPADDSVLRRLLEYYLRQLKTMGGPADAIRARAQTAEDRARADPLNCTLVGNENDFWATGAHKQKFKVHEAFWLSTVENLNQEFGPFRSLASVGEHEIPEVVKRVKR